MPPRVGDMILVQWTDSCFKLDKWEFRSEAKVQEMNLHQSVGFLLYEDSERVELTMNQTRDQVLGRLMIPRSAIRHMDKLVKA